VKRAVQLNAVLFKIDVNSSDDTLSNPLQYTPGIVLIDEIDLHLHPRWQRVIIPKLREYFPEIQFVVTTHSPFVLQAVPPTQRIRLINGIPEYYGNDIISDFQATLIDYFSVMEFFDLETERDLKKFRILLQKVARNELKKDDPKFKNIIRLLCNKGDVIKRLIAFELAQLIKKEE
jgi:predicted ATP-binding protein involved in virulence